MKPIGVQQARYTCSHGNQGTICLILIFEILILQNLNIASPAKTSTSKITCYMVSCLYDQLVEQFLYMFSLISQQQMLHL